MREGKRKAPPARIHREEPERAEDETRTQGQKAATAQPQDETRTPGTEGQNTEKSPTNRKKRGPNPGTRNPTETQREERASVLAPVRSEQIRGTLTTIAECVRPKMAHENIHVGQGYNTEGTDPKWPTQTYMWGRGTEGAIPKGPKINQEENPDRTQQTNKIIPSGPNVPQNAQPKWTQDPPPKKNTKKTKMVPIPQIWETT